MATERKELFCDVFVAGGGPAGIAAALSAARAGADTILCERYGVVGGGLVTSFVRPLLGGVKNASIGSEIERRLEDYGDMASPFERAKIVLSEMLQEAGVRVLLQTQITGAGTENGKIVWAEAVSQAQKYRFYAKTYIDATGDGNLACLSGCEIETGRDGDGLVQPASLMFTIDGIEPDDGLCCCHEEDYRPLPNGEEYLALCHEACRIGELPPSVNIVRLYDIGCPGERMVNATQYNRLNPLDPKEMFRAECDLRRQIVMVVRFLRAHVPGFAHIRVTGSASTLGVRESRRVIGDYVLTGEDLIAGRKFPDAIVHDANFCIDIHNPDGAGQAETEGRPHVAQDYDIPYRSLTPRGLSNLLTAGRCISGSHRAHASYRVMRICMATGHAAGLAAAAACKTGDTRKIDVAALQKELGTAPHISGEL